MSKKSRSKADPWKMYAPNGGVDLFRCNKCFHIADEQNYDVLGADDGNLFCNQCAGYLRRSGLKALGNSQVPQTVCVIARAMMQAGAPHDQS